jgi:hypothetical protein
MADITMTQVTGTTHHYFANINVDPGTLEPTIDLKDALDASGNPIKIPESIQDDPYLESIIDADFEAQTTSITSAKFKPGSFDPVALTIALEIVTTAIVPEVGALAMRFEFLHSGTR